MGKSTGPWLGAGRVVCLSTGSWGVFPSLGDRAMSDAFMILPNFNHHQVENPPLLQDQAVIPAKPDHSMYPEQIEAVDTVFAQDQDKASMLGLFAVWNGAMLLGDMAREHLNRADEDEEDDKKRDQADPDGAFEV
jgi:hypothetical protein